MTAPGSGEQITAELAEALLDADYEQIDKANWRAIVGDDVEASYDAYLDALLPVVEAYATRKAAEELRAMADEEFRNGSSLASFRLLDRADALTATHTDGATT